jgi:hypothetical protein
MYRFSILAGSLALSAIAVGGCSNGAGPSSTNQLNFNLATQPAPAAINAAAGASFSLGTPETFTDGANTLVINQVQLVLREIELHRAGAVAECAGSSSDGCEELEFGPVLVDVPLGTPGAARNFSVQIAPGSYDKVEFKIHTPSSSDDAGFVQANPDFQGVSVRVTGTYNGAAFTYTGDFEAEMEFDLNPALVANETAATDLTLFVNLDQWFHDQTGTLLNPNTANSGQPNETLVEQNIQASMQTFEDEDHDGRDDHGGADDGANHT